MFENFRCLDKLFTNSLGNKCFDLQQCLPSKLCFSVGLEGCDMEAYSLSRSFSAT